MDKAWTKVYSTTDPHLGAIIKGSLEENEIECIIINKRDFAYNFGELELFVKKDNAIRAIRIIEEQNT